MKKKAKKARAHKLCVLDYKGLIVSRAMAHYRLLPMYWQERLPFIDFVNDGVAYIIEKLERWDARRGRPSTFVHTTVSNFYKDYLTNLMCPKRGAPVLSLDALMESLTNGGNDPTPEVKQRTGSNLFRNDGLTLEDPTEFADAVYAEKNVTRLHSRASFELLCFLDSAFFHPKDQSRINLRSQKFNMLRSEFRELAKRYEVDIHDYRLVIAVHHTRMQKWEEATQSAVAGKR